MQVYQLKKKANAFSDQYNLFSFKPMILYRQNVRLAKYTLKSHQKNFYQKRKEKSLGDRGTKHFKINYCLD